MKLDTKRWSILQRYDIHIKTHKDSSKGFKIYKQTHTRWQWLCTYLER